MTTNACRSLVSATARFACKGSGLLIAALALLCASPAQAQWTNTTTQFANFDDPNNWAGGIINGQFIGNTSLNGSLTVFTTPISSASFASGSNLLLTGTLNTNTLVVGEAITGTGIAAGTTILAIDNAGEVTLSQNTTAASTGSALTVTGWGAIGWDSSPGIVATNGFTFSAGSNVVGTGTTNALQFAVGEVVSSSTSGAVTTFSDVSAANNASGQNSITLGSVTGLAVGQVLTAVNTTTTASAPTTSGANVTVANGALFAQGQVITGVGIAANTVINTIAGNTLTLATNVTGTGVLSGEVITGTNSIAANSIITNITGNTITFSGTTTSNSGTGATFIGSTAITAINSAGQITLSNTVGAISANGTLTVSAINNSWGPSINPVTPTVSTAATAGSTTLTVANTSGLATGAVISGTGLDVATATTANAAIAGGATSLTVATATNIKVGQVVTGTGITAGTLVTSVSGTLVGINTPVQAGGITSGTALTFPAATIVSVNSSTGITLNEITNAATPLNTVLSSNTTLLGSSLIYENTDPADFSIGAANGTTVQFTPDVNNNVYTIVDQGAAGVARTFALGSASRTITINYGGGNAIFNIDPTTANAGSGFDSATLLYNWANAASLTKLGGGTLYLSVGGQFGTSEILTLNGTGAVNVNAGLLRLSWAQGGQVPTSNGSLVTTYNVQGIGTDLDIYASPSTYGYSLIPTTSTINLASGGVSFFNGTNSASQTISSVNLRSGRNLVTLIGSNTSGVGAGNVTLTNGVTRNNNATLGLQGYFFGGTGGATGNFIVGSGSESTITSQQIGGTASTTTLLSKDNAILPWASAFYSGITGGFVQGYGNGSTSGYGAEDFVTYIPVASASIASASTPTISVTNTSATVIVSSTAGLVAGQAITGTGIVAGSYIASIVNGTTFTLTGTATATSTSGTSTISAYNNEGFHPLLTSEMYPTLVAASTASDSLADVNITASGTLTAAGGAQTINALLLTATVNPVLTLNNALTITSGGLISGSFNNTLSSIIGSGSINTGSNPLITQGGSLTISVNLTNSITGNNNVGLIVANIAPVYLNAQNGVADTYGGSTDVQGKLVLGSNGNGAPLPTGTALRIDLGGTVVLGGSNAFTTTQQLASLAGNGTIAFSSVVSGGNEFAIGGPGVSLADNTVQVNSGGSISPGDASGTLQAGTFILGTTGTVSANLTLLSGAALNLDLSSSALTGNDQVQLTGGKLTFGVGSAANTLVVNYNLLGSSVALGTPYVLVFGASSVTNFANTSFTTTGLPVADAAAYSSVNGSLQVTFETLPKVYWQGNQNTVWNTNAGGVSNFTTDATGTTNTGAAPTALSNVVFTSNTASTSNVNTTLGADTTINSLEFTGTGTPAASTSYTIGGANTLTLTATATGGNTAGNGITVDAGSAAQTITSKVALGASQTWTVNNSASNPFTVNGVISDGGSAYKLTKSGTGTLVLGGANTHTGGTEISAGGLVVSNTTGSAVGTGAFQLDAGATLSGTGTIATTASNNINGTVIAGPGGLTTSGSLILTSTISTTIGATANLTFNLQAIFGGPGVTGSSNELNIGSSALAFSPTGTFTLNLIGTGSSTIQSGTDYILIAGTSNTQYSGLTLSGSNVISGLTINITGTGLSTTASFYNRSYLFLSNGDLEVQVVPEPGTWALMLGGLAMLVVVQVRRRRNP